MAMLNPTESWSPATMTNTGNATPWSGTHRTSGDVGMRLYKTTVTSINRQVVKSTGNVSKAQGILGGSMDYPESQLNDTERAILEFNRGGYEVEPEDNVLIESGILDDLLTEIKQKPPIEDWERYLDEL